jgi:diaminopimelate epimerase
VTSVRLAFEKWHGCGNDFVVLRLTDVETTELATLRAQAARLCDRHVGIGADGLLALIAPQPHATPTRLVIVNSDGSIANNCGNGLRCAMGAIRRGGDATKPLTLTVEGRAMACGDLGRDAAGLPFFSIGMGVPAVGAAVPWRAAAIAAVAEQARAAGLAADAIAEVEACSIGNPHVVVTMASGRGPGATRDVLLALGPPLQRHDAWDGVNVHVVEPRPADAADVSGAKAQLGGDLTLVHRAFTWERGAGETLACGSGAAAVAVCALAAGRASRSTWVGVDMPGGRLYARQDRADEPVTLAGPATYVYSGSLEL